MNEIGEYIVPKNYDIKPKLLGIIDYSAVAFFTVTIIILYFIISLFIKNVVIKVQITIITVLPILIFAINGLNGENISYVLKYIIAYILKKKIHIYEKKY